MNHSTETVAHSLYPEYAPDYYAIFFSDPDGIRLELTNFRQEMGPKSGPPGYPGQ